MASGSPISYRITVERNDFPKIAAKVPQVVERVVAKTALDLSAQMKARAAVDTGFMRGSIIAKKVTASHWRVTVGAEYAIYVEMGTRHTRAQPFVQPSVAAITPVFRSAMRKALSTL